VTATPLIVIARLGFLGGLIVTLVPY
jgi:hypothetical protein